jgi:preprotein translocase subunit SecY
VTSGFKRRVAFTVGALLIYRLGCYIPVPGINPALLEQLFRAPAHGNLTLLLLFSGGGLRRVAIFALGIVPYISAAVLVQLAAILSRRLRALDSQGRTGRQTIRTMTLALTTLLAAFQAYGVAAAIEGVHGAVANPDGLFVITTIITLTGGVLLLAWLSEQITSRGIGNGIALILLAGAVTPLSEAIVEVTDTFRRHLVSSGAMFGLAAIFVVVVGFIVLMELAQRHLPVRYSTRLRDGSLTDNSSYLLIKLNSAGIIPIVLTAWALWLPIALATASQGPRWLTAAAGFLYGQPIYSILFAILIVICTFFYTANVLDPEALAERLRVNGGTIATIDPGESAANHIDYVVSRTTAIGAVYLALIIVMPEILAAYTHLPLHLRGQLLLILVCTMLDLKDQIRGELRLSRRGSLSK